MEWIRECLTNVVAIFPMANPFSTVPLLLSLSARMSIEERVKLGDRACKNAVIFMLITLFMGTLLLHFFNISVPSLRIAGGLVVAFLGFGMLFHKEVLDSVDHDSASQSTVDYSIIPLAFPSLSGAGTLATIMTISASITAKETLSAQLSGYAACAVAIIIIGLLSLIIFRAADRIKKFLGAEGLESMTRIMGLIMVCIGVQLIATGIGEFITNPKQIYPSANAVEMKEVILQNSSEAKSQSIQQNDK